jgi:cysteine-rich repeat protein
VCGDSVVDEGEECDDGINDGSYGGCNPDCQGLGPHCGDGQLDGPEVCDDGDGVNGNGCNNDCNESGQVVWTMTYDSPAHDTESASGAAVWPCADENCTGEQLVVVGSERRNDLDERNNLWLAKYDISDGAEVWMTTYDSPTHHDDFGSGVELDELGTIYVGGQSSDGLGFEHINILYGRFSAEGALELVETYDTPGDHPDSAYAIALDAEANVFLSGYHGGEDAWVGKFDNDGNELWMDVHNGVGNDDDYAYSLVHDGDGGVVVAGRERGLTSDDTWIRRYDPDGNELWTTIHAAPANSVYWGRDVARAGDGTFVVVGRVDADLWLAKFTPDGDEVWATTFSNPGTGNVLGYGVAVDSEGNIVVAGALDRFDIDQGYNILVLKYSSVGELMWMRTEMSNIFNGNESANDVVVDAEDNILVVGAIATGQFDNVNQNIWIRKYTP